MMRFRTCLIAAVAIAPITSAQASPREQARIFRDLVDCRAITDNAARLSCYDGKVATMAQAADNGDLVVADKGQIKEAKRSLFGFGSVRLPFLGGGGGDNDADAPTEIEATTTAVRQISYSRWEITLDNNMRWRQTDDEQISPRTGRKVTVKRAAMGSYMMRIDGKSVRVMRLP